MGISINHIFNRIRWATAEKKRFFSACCSNFKYDFPLLFNLNKTIIINSWIDIQRGEIKPRNFGDDLNYYLFSQINDGFVRFFNCSFLSLFKRKNYLCIGSTIHHGNRHSIVWGAGCISHDGPIPALKKVLAVRGPMTRELLIQKGINCPQIYGDPALLLPFFYKPNKKPNKNIGIVLNAADEFAFDYNRFDNNYSYISMTNYYKWEDVIDKITGCKLILSSSLHGLIIADAYNIPNLWVSVDNNKNVIGGFFKYLDYFSSVDRHQNKPIEINEILESGIDKYLGLIEKPMIHIKPLLNSCPFKLQKQNDNIRL